MIDQILANLRARAARELPAGPRGRPSARTRECRGALHAVPLTPRPPLEDGPSAPLTRENVRRAWPFHRGFSPAPEHSAGPQAERTARHHRIRSKAPV